MIVLGICAVLVAGLLNFRDLPVLQAAEGKLLDIRFLLRGPTATDGKLRLVLLEPEAARSDDSPVATGKMIAAAIDRLTLDGANVIALGPSLIPYLKSGADAHEGADPGAVALALSAAQNPAVGYQFFKRDTGITKWPKITVPEAVKKNLFRDYRFTENAPASPFVQPTGINTPAQEVLAAAMPGHVVPLQNKLESRHFSYPVIGYNNHYYPSLALEIARLSLAMKPTEVTVIFGQGLAFNSFYIPTDNAMRMAVNYRGPAGSFESFSLADVAAGKFDSNSFLDKTVILGTQADGNSFAVPFGGRISDAEYLANVASNYWLADPLDRSQKVVVLDIIMISLIGVFLALLATLRNGGVVFVLATLAGGLICFVNFKAFTLINIWLNLTFPLTALALCTGYLVYAKAASNRRERLLAEAERTEVSKYATPWIAERVAKARQLEEDSRQREKGEEIVHEPKISAKENPAKTAWLATEEPLNFEEPPAPEKKQEVLPPEVVAAEKSDLDPEEESPLILEEVVSESWKPRVDPEAAEPESKRESVPEKSKPEPVASEAKREREPAPEAETEEPSAQKSENIIIFEPDGPIKESRNAAKKLMPEKMPEVEADPEPEPVAAENPKKQDHAPTQEELEAALQAPLDPVEVSAAARGMKKLGTFPVAVFYLDMSSFYAVGKTFGPAKTARFLHAVQGLIEREVESSHGVLEEYSRNGLMGIFGLPEQSADDAFNALNCARNIAKGLATLIKRESLPANQVPEFCLCLHSGPISVYASETVEEGEDTPSLEINGDTVFVASRLKTLVSDKQADVVVSSKVMEKITADSTTDFLTKGFEETPLEGEEGSGRVVNLWTWKAVVPAT